MSRLLVTLQEDLAKNYLKQTKTIKEKILIVKMSKLLFKLQEDLAKNYLKHRKKTFIVLLWIHKKCQKIKNIFEYKHKSKEKDGNSSAVTICSEKLIFGMQ